MYKTWHAFTYLLLKESKLSQFYYRAAFNAGQSNHDKAVCLTIQETLRLFAVVRLSVYPSDRRMICDITEEICAHVLIPHKRPFILASWKEERLLGATPSSWNFASSWPRWSENADFQSIFSRSFSAVIPSKKVQITLIGSPLCWEYHRISYIAKKNCTLLATLCRR